MSDHRPPPDDRNDGDDESPDRRANIVFLPIGIAFMALGIVFMTALDSLALGLVFLPVGVVFIALSVQQSGEDDTTAEASGGDGRRGARRKGDGTVPFTASDSGRGPVDSRGDRGPEGDSPAGDGSDGGGGGGD